MKPARDWEQRRRLLVVGEDDLVRRSARRVLSAHGFCVDEARSHEEAVGFATLREGGYAAALLDVGLPSDRLPLIQLLRRHWPNLPIVVMTSDPETRPLLLGVDAILFKPAHIATLLETLALVGATWDRR